MSDETAGQSGSSAPVGADAVLTPGVLTLAATPIGNPLDATVRLTRALREADLIAAEDTRRLKRLATALGIRPDATTVSYHEHNEEQRTDRLLRAAAEGQRVLIVTDAGMPVVSDPGFRAVRAALETGCPVDVLPGPSAPVTALAHTGIAPDRFAFEGFLPRRPGQRTAALQRIAADDRTLIFFESPRRTALTLAAMRKAFGADRSAAVCRELTKTHQEIKRGTLAELTDWAEAHEVLGEVVIVVEGAGPEDAAAHAAAQAADPMDLLRELVADGTRLKDAAKQVAAQVPGVRSRDLYEQALAEKH